MIGDVVGKPGRKAVQSCLPGLRQEYGVDMVVANGENSAGGFGVTPETAHDLLSAGVDVITSGNHIWKQKEVIPYIDEEPALIRPANYPPGVPGRGYVKLGDVAVMNLMGRVFMSPLDCPFRTADHILREIGGRRNNGMAILVDFHAEATSEKQAMAWYLDGRVSAVLGTHTHVPTADPRIFPQGTAYISDVGMVGPQNSVIGTDVESVLEGFLTQMPKRFSVPQGPVQFNSVLVDLDDDGRASDIQRIDRVLP